jgi:YHS domain-containing protein/uncharacterized membrane protein YraQ (UPF0718 family)
MVGVVASIGWIDEIGRSLREAFFMFWETLWPLILGFGLSGAVQAFVSRESMQRKFANHRPAAVARASGYGMVSSSCSYAASAMAKSLFVKGADFTSSMVFMFASTNLVLELGIILIVLMGWQFAASEFVGGAIMIVLLASVGGLWLRGRQIAAARNHLVAESGGARGATHDTYDEEAESELQRQPWSTKLRSTGGWANAATYTMADLTMLRRELLFGFTFAGFLAVVVPTHVWNLVFLHGHGFWTSLENAVVGPFIAIVSFVCSIGNVPLAAALWHGGISFGGVVSFIFADLITFPLLLIYRRYYGTTLMLKMLVVFWGVMSLAGLLTEGLFNAAHLVPATRPAQIAPAHFAWNYTTYLNIVFLAIFGVLYWAYRNRERLGGGGGYALDPVCGMQVETANAPASVLREGVRVYFCSDHCRRRFDADPNRFATSAAASHVAMAARQLPLGSSVRTPTESVDPVCAMTVDVDHAAATRRYGDVDYFFCGVGCAEKFAANPERYLKGGPVGMSESGPSSVGIAMSTKHSSRVSRAHTHVESTDPVCAMTVDVDHAAATRRYGDVDYFFCGVGCAEKFDANPGLFVAPSAGESRG